VSQAARRVRAWQLAAVAAAAGLGLVLWWQAWCGDCLPNASLPRWAAPSLLAAGGPGAPEPAAASVPAAAAATGGARPVAVLEQLLFRDGPLRGTEAPPWGTSPGAPVLPNRALRDRFDYLLLGQGELSLAELTALVRTQAEHDLGAVTAQGVLAVWQHYLQLQQHAYQHVALPGDPARMQVALQEHRQVRQAVLGLHWALAFYGEEEAQLAADIERRLAGEARAPARSKEDALLAHAPAAPANELFQQRAQRFGPEAAQRLAALDQEEARWAERIGAARQAAAAIRANPAWSAPQQEEALQRLLDQAFPDAGERLRASALLNL
jgi:lipase chaperone LimK